MSTEQKRIDLDSLLSIILDCKDTKSKPLTTKFTHKRLYFNYFKERLVHFNGTVVFLKIESLFGLKQSPHARGSVVVYKNRIRQGYYSDFYKGFFAETKNNLLYIKDVKDVDSEGNPIFGILNTIDFKDGIPNNIFIYIENGFGDEHILITEF